MQVTVTIIKSVNSNVYTRKNFFQNYPYFFTRPQNFSNPVLGQNFKECRFEGALNY